MALEEATEIDHRIAAMDAGAASVKPKELPMWMTVGERRFAITLIENAATRAFAAQLPLSCRSAAADAGHG